MNTSDKDDVVAFGLKRKLINAASGVLGICVCSLVITSCSRSEPKYYWAMSESCPDSGVRIWFPDEATDHKICNETNVTRALALAVVLNIIQEVEHRKIHYHIREQDRGFVLTEYLADPKSKTGERRLGRDEKVHYHGVYVDLETAKELIRTVKTHQHGAD